jgi:hypothetical protein
MIINELLMHDLEFDLCKLAGSGTGVKNPRNVPAKGFEIDCKADRWRSDGSGRTSGFFASQNWADPLANSRYA